MARFDVARHVLAQLKSGTSLSAKQIARALSTPSVGEIAPRNVSAVLSRISDPHRCALGWFIDKSRSGNAWTYALVEAARTIPENKLYGLSVRVGKDRYSLKQALSEYPCLRKHVATPPETPPRSPFFKLTRHDDSGSETNDCSRRRSEATAAAFRNKMDRTVELTFRHSNRYAISISTSIWIILLLICTTIAIFGICVYLVFYPLLIAGLFFGAIGAGYTILKYKRFRT